MGDHHAALERPGTDPDERDPIAMGGVHAGLDLEDEPGERRVEWVRVALPVGARGWRRCQVDQGVQQVPHAEVQHRGTEQHRRRLTGQIGLGVVGQAALGEQLVLLHGLQPRVRFLGERLRRG